MIKVDDLVEPRPEEIALSGLPTFIRPHESPRRRPQAARESRPARRINLQENLSTTAATRQIRLLRTARKLQPIRGLGVLHGRLDSGCRPRDPCRSPETKARRTTRDRRRSLHTVSAEVRPA